MTRSVFVCETEPAGDLTPWSAFLALDDGAPAVLLESARQHPKIGRYSVVAVRPSTVWQARGRECVRQEGTTRVRYEADPLAELRRVLKERRARYDAESPRCGASHGQPPSLPFMGGLIGYVAYEARHAFERLPSAAHDDLELPHWYMLSCDEAVVFDHEAGTVTAIAIADTPADRGVAEARAAEVLQRMRGEPCRPLGACATDGTTRSTFSKDEFEAAVGRVLDYIAAGDVYQVNVAQRLDFDVSGDPRTLYDLLRHINPSPFAAFLRGERHDGEPFTLVSSSPERLVCLQGSHAETRPIAGTRPRGNTRDDDERLRAELLLNEKERAEHVMLVDLERNDLGRVCRYGSVHVDEMMVLEQYSHVYHIVSNVVGELAPGKDALDLLAAMFPGGTITGCPKIRCMEIIDEVEPVARHAYTGSIGYLSDSGALDLNIVIRTITVAGGRAYLPVGAGIVADSIPEREYEETLHKAEALRQALAQASR